MASGLAISLVGLVALLQLVASHGNNNNDIDSETYPISGRRGDTDFSAAAEAAVVRGYRGQPCQLQDSCSVICQKTQDQLLSSSISQILENNKVCANSLRLEVSNVTFPDNTLAPGWLDVSANLSSLTLSDCQIDAVDDDAFNGPQFASLTELNLKGLTLRKLQTAALRPLRNITSLSLNECPDLLEVDPEVVAGLYKLTSVQVQRTVHSSNRHVLPAFAAGLNSQAIVDLRFNTLGTLQRKDLGSAAVLATSLFLKSSGIDDVLVGTFPSSENRQLLSLSNNNLTTLRNTSISFENRHSKFAIYLEDNPWHCDCSLLWLLPYVSTFADTPLCSTPHHFADWKLTSALEALNESCAVPSTTAPPETTGSSTTETAGSTGTPESPPTETTPDTSDEPTEPDTTSELPTTSSESTTPFNTSDSPSTANGGTDSTTTSARIPTSAVPDELPDDLKRCYHVDFPYHDAVDDWSKDSVRIYDVDEFTIKISVPYDAAGGFLVWQGTHSPDCNETSPLTSPTVVLGNLEPGVDYSICVLRPEETRTSIRNCHPHRTMAAYSKSTLTSNSDSIMLALSLTVLGTFVLSVVLVALLRRPAPRRPSLIPWWPPPPSPRSPYNKSFSSSPASSRPSESESFSSTTGLIH